MAEDVEEAQHLGRIDICETISPRPKSRPEPKAVRMAGTAYAPMT